MQKLPIIHVKNLVEQNKARELAELPLIAVKIRRCPKCQDEFESIEARICPACNQAYRNGNGIVSFGGYDAI